MSHDDDVSNFVKDGKAMSRSIMIDMQHVKTILCNASLLRKTLVDLNRPCNF